MTATRRTPLGRPCFASREPTFLAALAVSLISRSSPTRKVGAAAGLLAAFAIMIQRLISLRAVSPCVNAASAGHQDAAHVIGVSSNLLKRVASGGLFNCW